MSIQYKELKRRYQLDGAEKTVGHLSEALRERHLSAEDFSIRDLAEALVPDGSEWVRLLDPRSGGTNLIEASDGVDTTAFQNVAGQVIYAKILDAYMQESFVVSKLVSTVPTRLDGEKIPGVARIEDIDAEVGPGMPFPNVGFSEDYIETPATTKRGFIVPVTKEAIFFDRTNLILRRAAEVGELLGLNKEKAAPRCGDRCGEQLQLAWHQLRHLPDEQPLGERAGKQRTGRLDERRCGRATSRGYSRSEHRRASAGGWYHGVGDASLSSRSASCVHAAEIHYTGSGSTTSTIAANPLGNYTVAESRLAYRRVIASGEAAADAKKWWFVGDFKKAFAYMENWPITVTQAPRGSEAEFTQDIVLRFKASERGAAAVIDPRYVVKCTG